MRKKEGKIFSPWGGKGRTFYAFDVVVVVVGCPARKDLAVSTRKATEEAAQVGAGPECTSRTSTGQIHSV